MATQTGTQMAGWFTKEFDGAGGGGAVTLAWSALPATLDQEARLSRLTAWVMAAERAARPFALSVPGTSLPGAQGREHRHNALTALALFPREDEALRGASWYGHHCRRSDRLEGGGTAVAAPRQAGR